MQRTVWTRSDGAQGADKVCAYAVMSNHYHTVLFVDVERAQGWSDAEVVRRWKKRFGVPTLVQRWLRGDAQSRAELEAAEQLIATWRSRLMDVSWFMRCLNEHLARKANLEDQVTGRFWEGRFKSQALLDEAGLLTAMAYVDLNPIRAGIAQTPQGSEFTSIFERIRALKKQSINAPRLRQFRSQGEAKHTLPCLQADYLALLDWTGRAIRADQRSHINQSLPPILKRLNIDAEAWKQTMRPQAMCSAARWDGSIT